MEWEYLVHWVSVTDRDGYIMKDLNLLGKQGWQLQTSTTDQDGNARLYLMRQLAPSYNHEKD